MRHLISLFCGLATAFAAAVERRPVVAIADYMETNGVVSAKRGMTEALREAGFVPIVLPEMDRAGVLELLSRSDAVMIGGGIKGQDYDRRCAFEEMVISLAAEKGLPIVGICHGAQVINRYFGGTLGKVPPKGSVVHKDAAHFAQTGERAEHDVTVLPGDSLMARIFGAGTVRINSSHTMRCLMLADGFKLTAQAADGVVEAYEHVSRPIYGFQFHPEFYWQKDRRCLELLRQSLAPAARHWAEPPFLSTGLNADFQVKYPDAVAKRAPLRGVMLPPEKVTEKHFQTLKEWGVTLGRYQMMPTGPNAWLVTTNCARYTAWLDAKLDTLADEVLPLANRYGIQLVIDIHVPPGGRDGQIMHMCDRQDYLDCFVECWKRIATRLKGRSGIYGYDLINEPDQKRAAKIADYWEVQRRAAEAVRAIDPDTTILIASNGWNKPDNFAYLPPLAMDNVIYQVHVYQPMAFTHQGVLPKYKDEVTQWPDESRGWNKDWLRKLLEPVREFQKRHRAKIYAGEFSAVSWAEGSDRYLADLISLFEEYGWDWSYHAFREWPGWDAEKVCVGNARQPDKAKFKKEPDNPRLRVLRDAFSRKSPPLLSAMPVWLDGRTAERNLTVGFRVSLDGEDAAELRYSASSIARVWLNGEFLCYGPARGPHGTDRVDVIPLAGRMKNGRNILAFEVAGYNVESFYLLDEPAYLAAEVRSRDGRILAMTKPNGPFEATVISERVQKVPRFSYQRPFCEVYRLKADWSAWRTGGARVTVPLAAVAGSTWIERTAPYPAYDVSRVFRPLRRGRLGKRTPTRLHEGRSVTGEDDPKRGYAKSEIAVQPVYEIQRLSDANYVLYDHGLCDTGFLGAKVVCRKPGRVYFYFDEVLVNDDIDVSRMGWQCVNAVTYDFEEPGEYAIEAFEPNTFRYLKVMFDGFEGEVSDLFVRGYKNGETGRATFESSDPALNEIFAAARETFVQNAVDALTDCPSRERAGWLCDSFFSGRSERWLTGSNPVERCFLENFARTSYRPTKEDAFLPMCYPADAGLLPNWNFWFVFELEEYLARTGDRALIELMRPKVEGVIASFRKYRNADGLLEKLPGWVFVEWSKANELVQDVNYPSNMTYAKTLDAAARLYGWTDCAEEARIVRETVRRQSWTGEWFCDNAVRQKDGSLKLSGECTETCQYYAFYFGTADVKDYPELWNRLVSDFGPKRRKTKAWPKIHPANAFIGNYLRLELLSRAGLSAQILDETKGYLHGMARRTGTLWEHDNISNSCDHGFASHAAVVLFRDVLGVWSVDPVVRQIVIKVDPNLQLASCRGTVPLSATEELRVEWRKSSAGVDVRYVIPEGWTAKERKE